jgi:hypothetical protein
MKKDYIEIFWSLMGGIFFICINMIRYQTLSLFNIYIDIRDFPEVFFIGFSFTLILIISIKIYFKNNL